MFEIFFDYIETFLPLPKENRQQCRDNFEPHHFSKGSIIQESGRAPEFHNFVVQGHLRKYSLDLKGHEQTIDLNQGPRFFTSYEYFMEQKPSPETIVALTEVKLLRASKAQVDTMMQIGGQVIRDFTIMVMQQAWEEEKRRLHERATISAKQRYLNFIERYPTLLEIVPLQYIASYLGIQPESLSRIRREIKA